MTCADVRLDEYLDGELAEADRAIVDGHLASCAACRAELEQSRKLEKVLQSVPSGAAPDADRFVQSVRARSRRRLLPWASAAAAALLMGLVGVLLLQNRPVDIRAELTSYAQKPTEEIESRIRSTGPAGLGQLEKSLDDLDVK
ncbi:MAG: hypothetical protein EHM91_17760, partial [Planctomycetota bacterium]